VSGWREAARACVHCGLCLPACPTYRELREEAESPRGRIQLLEALLTDDPQSALRPADVAPHIDRCIGCLACETACPSGVAYGELLEEGRRRLGPQKVWVRWLLQYLLPRTRLVRALAAGGRMFGKVPRARMPRTWPSPPPQPRARIAMHLGCVTPALYPHLAHDAAVVLTHLGYAVEAPSGQRCCGALLRHAGLPDTSERAAIDRLGREYDMVVSATAGCSVTDGITDVTNLVLDEIASGGRALAGARISPARRVAWDAPCHLQHAQGIHVGGLLRNIDGIELQELAGADHCCGAGGLYMAVSADLARDVRASKLDAIEESGADTVATANPGCMFWLWRGLRERGLSVEVRHPVSLLAEALGKPEYSARYRAKIRLGGG